MVFSLRFGIKRIYYSLNLLSEEKVFSLFRKNLSDSSSFGVKEKLQTLIPEGEDFESFRSFCLLGFYDDLFGQNGLTLNRVNMFFEYEGAESTRLETDKILQIYNYFVKSYKLVRKCKNLDLV